MDKLEEAIADFQKSIILSPSFPTSYIQKAYAGMIGVCVSRYVVYVSRYDWSLCQQV